MARYCTGEGSENKASAPTSPVHQKAAVVLGSDVLKERGVDGDLFVCGGEVG